MKTEQVQQETTPNAKAKVEVSQTSRAERIQNSLTPGAKAKAVGVVRSLSKVPCRFFLRDQCNKGDACSFSHAPVSDEQKQDAIKAASVERSKAPQIGHSRRGSSRCATYIASSLSRVHGKKEKLVRGCT